MNIKFTSKTAKLTGALKAFIEKRLQTIEKISGDIIDTEIIVSEEKLGFNVELIIKTKMNSYHIDGQDPLLKQAFRNALSSLKIQSKKNKEKIKREKKRFSKKEMAEEFIPAEFFQEKQKSSEASDVMNITISENYSHKPLSPEEAVFFLKESGENAYMFLNAETNNIAVIFFNKKKGISIIDADIEK